MTFYGLHMNAQERLEDAFIDGLRAQLGFEIWWKGGPRVTFADVPDAWCEPPWSVGEAISSGDADPKRLVAAELRWHARATR